MGAIVPQRRISKTRKRLRRSHFKLDNPSMMVCPNCGEVKLAHTVCSSCGYYDGRLVKEIKVKKDEALEEEKKVEEKKPAKKATTKKVEEKAEPAVKKTTTKKTTTKKVEEPKAEDEAK